MTTKTRGFGSLSPERQKELASMGGTAAWKKGSAHRFTPEQARAAALKGLETRRRKALEKGSPQ